MLTQHDLFAIEQLLDRKLDEKLEQKLEEKLELKFDEKLRPLKKDIQKIQHTLDATIRFFDSDVSHLRQRVDSLETFQATHLANHN